MPAYNFQSRFVTMILDGSKPHTIRKKRARRPTVAGDRLFLYTGMRTKNSALIANALCTKVEPVIIYPFIGHIKKNGVLMEEQEIEALAKADGFQDVEQFFDFFRKTYKKSELNDFEIIHWDVASMKKAIRLVTVSSETPVDVLRYAAEVESQRVGKAIKDDLLKAVHDGEN